jgi:hypothetical protein
MLCIAIAGEPHTAVDGLCLSNGPREARKNQGYAGHLQLVTATERKDALPYS